MHELELLHGPKLVKRCWNPDLGEGQWVYHDVTTRAHEFLFDTVALAANVTLADLFGLLDAAPVLQAVLRREFCEELLVEARKGVSPDFVPGYATDAIEFLELYANWSYNSATREYQPLHHLEFHALGYELRETLDEGGGMVYQAGQRIQWSVSCTPVRQLLALPLRVSPRVTVNEDDLTGQPNWTPQDFGRRLDEFTVAGVSLGQVLHGVLWELSFHGGPQQTAEFREELKQAVVSIQD